jgi:hypothetical protein
VRRKASVIERIGQAGLPSDRFTMVKGADDRDLRTENTLIDENGDPVKLKKGARVEVTVTAKAER